MAAISDHNHLAGSHAAAKLIKNTNFKLIPHAQEYTSYNPYIHFNVFGMPTDVSPALVPPTNLPRFVKETNGYVVLNHYFKGNGHVRPFYLREVASWTIDGVEMVNGWIDLETDGATAELRQFCLSEGLACVSGSDEHQNRELRYFMRVQFADSDHLSLAKVFSTLKKNRHQVVAIR